LQRIGHGLDQIVLLDEGHEAAFEVAGAASVNGMNSPARLQRPRMSRLLCRKRAARIGPIHGAGVALASAGLAMPWFYVF
jgi:hypothetical protein